MAECDNNNKQDMDTNPNTSVNDNENLSQRFRQSFQEVQIF